MHKAIGYSCYNSALETPRALTPWIKQGYTIIAIDGRYKTPQSPEMLKKPQPNYSTDNTEEVLKELCGDNDNLVYERYYGEQVKKRQRYMDIAGDLGIEILIVWDSDDYIHPEYQDWQWFNRQLEDVMISGSPISYMWCWIPDETKWPKQWNVAESNKWHKYMRIHKNPGEQQYALTHWSFISKETARTVPIEKIEYYALEHGIILAPPYFLKPEMVIDGVRFTTDRIYRSPGQREYGDGWAFQEDNEDKCRMYNCWLKSQKHLIPLDLSKPHYYDERGRLVWHK